MSVCYSKEPCNSQCTCEGTSLNLKMDCSKISRTYFLHIFEIPLSVSKIILKNNNMEHFSKGGAMIGQQKNVWSIDISGNRIMNFEENQFQHMFSNLRFLDLSNNRIRQIKYKAFLGLKLLTALYLGQNQISFIFHFQKCF